MINRMLWKLKYWLSNGFEYVRLCEVDGKIYIIVLK